MRAAALLLVLLAGCASKPTPITASVRIPVPCVTPEELPQRPAFVTEAELLEMESGDIPVALELHRLQALAYIRSLEAIAQGCSRLPAER